MDRKSQMTKMWWIIYQVVSLKNISNLLHGIREQLRSLVNQEIFIAFTCNLNAHFSIATQIVNNQYSDMLYHCTHMYLHGAGGC